MVFDINVLALFLLMAGFVIGLGAVTVINIHGWLGQTSLYWTEATTRTHKVTKPLIWVGITLAIAGSILWFRDQAFQGIPVALATIAPVLIANGCFLSFIVSPFLLRQEREGNIAILPVKLRRAIFVSFLLSDAGWWISLFLVVQSIVERI